MKNNKKILIITLYGNFNFGNKLQNYALQEKIKSLGFDVETLVYKYTSPSKIKNVKRVLVETIKKIILIDNDKEREKKFLRFNSKYLNFKSGVVTYYKVDKKTTNDYDYYIYGSDQIWNPYYIECSPLLMGELTNKEKNISYAASFGISQLPDEVKNKYKESLNNFKFISLREEEGKKIVDDLRENKDSTVLIDPTMLLTSEDWDKIIKKPTGLETKKYILNCFLGELSFDKKKVIQDFAIQNNCDIIDIYDKESLFYNIDPSEFLYLEKNAYLICTDSFHSCVFSILFNRPFVVFERESNTLNDMYSRIDNLLSKFKIENRKYNGKCITDDNLKCDYKASLKILEEERKKSDEFLKMSLNVKEKN